MWRRATRRKKSLFFLGGASFLGGSGKGRGILRPEKKFFGGRLSPSKKDFFVARRLATKKECLFSYSLEDMLKNPWVARRLGTRNFKNTDQHFFKMSKTLKKGVSDNVIRRILAL